MFEWRIGDTTLRVGVPFFALTALILTLDRGPVTLSCMLASALHEGGHLIPLFLWKHAPRRISLGVFGISILQRTDTLSYAKQSAVLLAGPAVNLLMAALLAATGGSAAALTAHLVMGCFNLLPVEALDGGQCLYCLLASRYGESAARRTVRGISAAFLLPLATLGFFLLLQKGNPSLLAVSVYLVLRLFGKGVREI